MIIDESCLEGGINEDIVYKLIVRHMQTAERYSKLKDYYLGNHAIKYRSKNSSGTVNNRVVCNHAKYIVDMAKSFLIGNPITYACSGYCPC